MTTVSDLGIRFLLIEIFSRKKGRVGKQREETRKIAPIRFQVCSKYTTKSRLSFNQFLLLGSTFLPDHFQSTATSHISKRKTNGKQESWLRSINDYYQVISTFSLFCTFHHIHKILLSNYTSQGNTYSLFFKRFSSPNFYTFILY